MGEVNGRFFANSVGLGFDGAVAEAASKVRYLKGFPAYLWSVFTVLKDWTNFELTLTADGRVLEGLAFLAAVANGPRSGGGFLLAPAAQPDDGLFDVCRLGDLGKLEALRHLPKALDGSHVGLPWVTILRAREVILASDRPLTAHVDGNLVFSAGHPDPLVFRMHPTRAARDRELERGWCPGAELNRRHRAFQARALPTELPGLAVRPSRPRARPLRRGRPRSACAL